MTKRLSATHDALSCGKYQKALAATMLTSNDASTASDFDDRSEVLRIPTPGLRESGRCYDGSSPSPLPQIVGH